MISSSKKTDRESAEIAAMLEMDRDALSSGKLKIIEPEKWKNQSINVTTAIRVLKEQQLIQIENFYHVKRFLDRFSKKVLAFMQTQDQEMNLLKNKTQRDMQILDRQIDEKIRQNQKSVMEHVESMGLRYDAIIDK